MATPSPDAVAADVNAKPSWWRRLVVLLKSSGVGLAATASDLGTTTLLVRCFGFSKQVANVPGLLPGIAVMFIGNKYFAFEDHSRHVVKQGARFAARPVKLGPRNAIYSAVASGLKVGDEIALQRPPLELLRAPAPQKRDEANGLRRVLGAFF